MEQNSGPPSDQSTVASPQPKATGDFAPGTLLAGRYRIVTLLGRGGMGEVYRADDLTLGQSVALKFLPDRLADANHLTRFRQEVALARRVSHPHVCRVYDIGEHQGRTFLSMESIDGENLASLLLRVGRLTEEKALEIARQLCGALAALHDQGLLHRDLKPANIMLDGRGAVRLADFGLMAFAENVADVRSGTPLYMAPEQLTGKEVTRQSDLFALGLVLFEVFTGKRAFPASSLAELKKLYQDGSPSKPSSYVAGLNPVIERILLQCLEMDPTARPRSANEILAALPGDLLAAAVAAGEVPSPDLVANAPADGELSLRTGLLALGGIVLALGVVLFLTPHATLLGRYPPTRPLDVLRERAQETLAALGHDSPRGDWAHGFAFDDAVIARTARGHPSAADWDALGRALPPPLFYWYRESPQPLLMLEVPSIGQNHGLPTPDQPPMEPGSARVRLDRLGRLVRVERDLLGVDETALEADWGPLFKLAGLSVLAFEKTAESGSDPLIPADRTAAWTGTAATGEPLRVETATYRGHPVYFAIVRPVAGQFDVGVASFRSPRSVYDGANRLLGVSLLVLAVVLAWRHWQLGLGDRLGTIRLGAWILGTCLAIWALRSHHVASLREVELFQCGLHKIFYVTVIMAIFYLALEPIARRYRPQALISWTRLLHGRVLDPLVGRDLLLGILAGAVCRSLVLLVLALPVWIGGPASVPEGQELGTWGTPMPALLGGREALGSLLRAPLNALADALGGGLMLLVVLQTVLQSRRAGAFVWWAIPMVLFSLQFGTALAVLCFGVLELILLVLLLRCGLLAYASSLFVLYLLQFPLTADLSAWYAGSGLLALGTILALAGYGFWVSARERT